MDKPTEKLIQSVALWGGGAFLAYKFILKPLLGNLGIDPQSQAVIDAQTSLPPSQNCFNAQFQPWVDFYNNNPPLGMSLATDPSIWDSFGDYLTMTPSLPTVITTAPAMKDFFRELKQTYDNNQLSGNAWGSIDVAQLSGMAETLNSAINGIHLTTNANNVMAVLSGLSSQMQLAFIAAYFLFNFNSDLLNNLKGSLFKQGLSGSDLAQVITNVNNLPVSSI